MRARRGARAVSLVLGAFVGVWGVWGAWGVWGCAGARPAGVRGGLAGLDVAFERLDGRSANLLDYAGAPTAVLLLATFDAPSLLMTQTIDPLAQALRPRGLRVVGIAVQPRARDLLPAFRDFARVSFDLGAASRELLDGETALGRVRVVPALVLIDRRGRVVRVHVGPIDGRTLREWLEGLIGS